MAQTATQNDDWLVSPELSGEAQTISFQVAEVTTNYGAEQFEVYYSTTDRLVSSFTKVLEGSVTSMQLAEVKVDLPAGARYFAIRYISADIFGLVVDDITYRTNSTVTPTGYNIYINEVLVGTAPADATTFEYTGALTDGDYKVSVSAVATTGETLPTSVNVAVTAIEQIGADAAQPANIYNLSGLRLRADQLKSGIYLIDGHKTSVK